MFPFAAQTAQVSYSYIDVLKCTVPCDVVLLVHLFLFMESLKALGSQAIKEKLKLVVQNCYSSIWWTSTSAGSSQTLLSQTEHGSSDGQGLRKMKRLMVICSH